MKARGFEGAVATASAGGGTEATVTVGKPAAAGASVVAAGGGVAVVAAVGRAAAVTAPRELLRGAVREVGGGGAAAPGKGEAEPSPSANCTTIRIGHHSFRLCGVSCSRRT